MKKIIISIIIFMCLLSSCAETKNNNNSNYNKWLYAEYESEEKCIYNKGKITNFPYDTYSSLHFHFGKGGIYGAYFSYRFVIDNIDNLSVAKLKAELSNFFDIYLEVKTDEGKTVILNINNNVDIKPHFIYYFYIDNYYDLVSLLKQNDKLDLNLYYKSSENSNYKKLNFGEVECKNFSNLPKDIRNLQKSDVFYPLF